MTEKRMKSRDIRDNWRNVLDLVRAGNEVIVEHYSKPIARIAPIKEPAVNTLAQDRVTSLAARVADAIDAWESPRQVTAYRRVANAMPEEAPRRAVTREELKRATTRLAQVLRAYPDGWTTDYPTRDDRAALHNSDLWITGGWYVFATPLEQPLSAIVWHTEEAISRVERGEDPAEAIAAAEALML